MTEKVYQTPWPRVRRAMLERDNYQTRLTEVLEWWVELVADLEPDTETFTVTMSRAMAERTLAAIDQLLDFPTDEQVEALFNDLRKVRAALEAVRDTMIGGSDD